MTLSGLGGIVTLPDPDFSNTEGRDQSVDLRLSIDGTRTTYVKSSERKNLSFTWSRLDRRIILAIEDFFIASAGELFNVTDFRGQVWNVFFASNPIDATMDGIASTPGGHNERGSITLEFTGT